MRKGSKHLTAYLQRMGNKNQPTGFQFHREGNIFNVFMPSLEVTTQFGLELATEHTKMFFGGVFFRRIRQGLVQEHRFDVFF